MPKVLLKSFNNFLGLDLRSSDLNRPPEFATGMTNCQFRYSGAIETRKGYKAMAGSKGGFGLYVYNKPNNTTGGQTPEMVTCSDRLSRLTATTFTITYSGSISNLCLFRLSLDTSFQPYQFRVDIDEGLIPNQFSYLIGNGFDDGFAAITLNNLASQINAIPGGLFTATITGDTTIPAAFLPITRDARFINGSPLVLTAYSWVDVNAPIAAHFPGSLTNKNSLDFENISGVQLFGVMYFGNGYDSMQKYDGQNVYLAGMPVGITPTGVTEIADGTAVREATNVTTVADVAGSLNAKWFVLYDKSGSVGVYFDNTASGAPFACAQTTARQIAVTTLVNNDPANTVATKLKAVLAADAQFSGTTVATNVVTVLTTDYGVRTDAFDGNPGTGFTIAVTAQGAGGLTKVAAYTYASTYVQKDATGNVVEGILSNPTAVYATSGSNKNIQMTVTNILAASGFNTNCALVNGNQSGVTTITVTNSPHTMKVGDTAYFLDRSSGLYVTRTVTATTSTTITISGANVNVNSADVISNNLRIRIWRNVSGGVLQYLVAEIPNNSFAATQTFVDNVNDNNIGFQYQLPLLAHGMPPKGKYLASWNGLLFVAGKMDDQNKVFYSSIENPEYFPPGANALLIETTFGDTIRGISPNNDVFIVYKDKSLHVISGDIVGNNIRVDPVIATEIGASSHHSIREAGSQNVFCFQNGAYGVIAGQLPLEISERIKPNFTTPIGLVNPPLQFRRAYGFNDKKFQRYLLYIPTEQVSGAGDRYAATDSKLYVFDYYKSRFAWYEWTNINMIGGMVEFNNQIFFQERRFSTVANAVQSILYQFTNLEDPWDYADQNVAINPQYQSAWLDMGDPAVFKKWIRFKPYVLETLNPPQFTLSVSTEVEFRKGPISSNFNLIMGAQSGYGLSPYGSSPYGDPGGTGHAKQRLRSSKAHSMRFIFSNSNFFENMVLSGFEIEAAPVYRPEIKE